MNKISCDICKDLIPLVKDGIASTDSTNAVKNHISECSKCYKSFEDINKFDEFNEDEICMNDKKIISKIRNQLIFGSMILIALGSFIGIAISESQWMFYNVVIMPMVGGLGYFAFNKKSYILPIGIFLLTYIWDFIKYIIERDYNGMDIQSIVIVPATWAIIYSGLCILGILIGFLLYVAFKKEND